MIPKAALSSPKLLESHSVLKNIIEKTEDEVKLTCHTAKQKVEEISHVLAICQSAVLTKFSPA